MKLAVFIALMVVFSSGSISESVPQKWENIKASASPETQEKAVSDLLDRIRPGLSDQFSIEIDAVFAPRNKDKVTLMRESNGSSALVQVKANTGVAAAWGIHHYLKYSCGCHFSWDTIQTGCRQSHCQCP